jgi:hypothetical protein
VDEALAQEVGRRWLAAMGAGDWAAAWRQTDRLELPRRAAQARPGFTPQPHHLTWDGTPFDGRVVRIRCQHGLGDTLQYLRFVPLVAAQARELHLMVQPPLVHLLRGGPGLGQVHDAWRGAHTWPSCEVDVEVMELAYAFRATAATVPPPYSHLHAQVEREPLLVRRDAGLLHVGLAWAASGWDPTRSLPAEEVERLLGLPGVRFYVLQQEDAAREPLQRRWPVDLLSPRTRRIEAAAAALLQLDLMLCIDGMPAHLAASLGVPTWLLLKHEADWRWGQRGSSTPWYPAMRLFRQPAPEDWPAAVAQVAAALLERTAAPTAAQGAHLLLARRAAPMIR